MKVLNKKLLRQVQYPISRVIAKLTVSPFREKNKKRDARREENRKNTLSQQAQLRRAALLEREKGEERIHGNNFVGDIQGHHLPAHVQFGEFSPVIHRIVRRRLLATSSMAFD